MRSNKFTEEFERHTGGAFPMLKFRSACYQKDTGMLAVRFLISAYAARAFGDDQKKKVDDVLKEMFAGVDVHAEYIRTYADDGTVRNKVAEYFNSHNPLVFRTLTQESVTVSVDESNVSVTLALDPAICTMLRHSDAVNELRDWLDSNFNQDISVTLRETEGAPPPEFDDTTQSVVVTDSAMRMISVEPGEKIYTRGKIAGISRMPAYIGDVKGAAVSYTHLRAHET